MYQSARQTRMYRVIIEEYQSWTETPDSFDLQALPKNEPPPKAKEVADWVQTEKMETMSKEVLAGILRSKAEELDQPKQGVR